MSLPEQDLDFLRDRNFSVELMSEGGLECLVIKDWLLPIGYDQVSSDLLIRLPPGYPDAPPDMWWFSPAITRTDGQPIEATQVYEAHLSRQWQRWSRHLTADHWSSGIDGLESYLAIIWNDTKRRGVVSV